MSNQNEDETLEDKIDDLEDQIHDLQVDLRDAYKTINELESQLSTIEEEHDQELRKCEDGQAAEMDRLREACELAQEMEKAAKKDADDYLKQLRTHDQNILNVLCMAESIRQKNYSFFETAEGRKTLDWAEKQLSVMKHKWRL